MKTIIFFILILTFNLSFSQQIKGVVSYYQNNGKPAAGIEINAFGCNKAYSFDNGTFILDCPDKSIGQPVRLLIGSTNNKGDQIELVNEAQLQFLVIPEDSNSSPIDLIVCYPGEKEKTAIKYYNLVENELLGSISKDIQKIVKSFDNSNLEREDRKKLTQKLNKLRTERDLAQQQAEKLANFIASINIPKANLLVKEAINAIESGKGTEMALAILNEQALREEEIDSNVRYFQNTVEILNGYFLRINLLLPKFKYQEVINSYEQIIRIFETNNFKGDGLANLYTSVAHICFLNGQYDKSLDLLEKGLSLWLKEDTFNDPKRASTMMNMGVYNNALGNTEQGLEFQLKAKEIIEKSPENLGKDNALGLTYSQIGNTYIKLNNYKIGLEYLQKGVEVLESSDFQFDRTRVLGIVYDNLAKGLKAVSAYEEALEAHLKSIRFMESVHAGPTPELATIYNNVANLLVELGRLEEAENYAKKALDIRLATLSPEHPQVNQSYLTKASILLQKESYNESLSIIQQIIPILESEDKSESENLIIAYQIQGYDLVKLKSFDEGLKQFEKSIAIRKNKGLGDTIILCRDNINLGALYSEVGNFGKSEKYLLAALEIIKADYPDNKADLVQIYFNLSFLNKSKEDLKQAYNFHEKCDSLVKEIYPESHPLRKKLNDLLIELEVKKGAELYKNGDYSDSLERFLFVVSKKPTFKIVSQDKTMPVFQFIGSCYYELENYKKAIEAEKNALDVYPEYELDNYYNAIGLSYFKIDELDEAKNAFEKYLEVASKEWRPYRNLSLYYAEVKNIDLAIQNLEKAIQFGFDDKKWLKKNKSFNYLAKNAHYKKLLRRID